LLPSKVAREVKACAGTVVVLAAANISAVKSDSNSLGWM